MDVSRVSMVTPKVIDWRKLTAKDIIKYDAEGMEIPSQYLSWARSFQVDLEKNDTDETTYEMAVSKPANLKQQLKESATATKTSGDNMSGNPVQPENTQVQENKSPQDIKNRKTPKTEQPENKTGNIENSTKTPQTANIQNNSVNIQNNTPDKQNVTAENQNKTERNQNNTTAIQNNTKVAETAPVNENTAQNPASNDEEVNEVKNTGSEETGNTTAADKTTTEKSAEDNAAADETQTEENNSNQKSVEEMTAQEKIKYLEEQGYSDGKILRTFRDDSNTKGSAAEEGSGTVSGVQDTSNSTAETVESFMQQVMSDAQDLQKKIEQGTKKDRQSNIARLSEQLNQLGTSAQTTLSTYETSYLGYGMSISEQEPVGLTAVDFGDATVELSEPFLRNFWTYALGRSAKKAGESASKNGSKLQEDATSAAQANDSNAEAISGHQNTVMDLTGVKAVAAQPLEGDGKNSDTAKTETKTDTSDSGNATDKTGKTANKAKDDKEEKAPVVAKAEEKLKKGDNVESDDKKTDVEKKEEKIASGSLDEILKRKLRKGEEVSA